MSLDICVTTALMKVVVIHSQRPLKIMAVRAPKQIISFITAPRKIIHSLQHQIKQRFCNSLTGNGCHHSHFYYGMGNSLDNRNENKSRMQQESSKNFHKCLHTNSVFLGNGSAHKLI
jgi:hypothetical protein